MALILTSPWAPPVCDVPSLPPCPWAAGFESAQALEKVCCFLKLTQDSAFWGGGSLTANPYHCDLDLHHVGWGPPLGSSPSPSHASFLGREGWSTLTRGSTEGGREKAPCCP